MKKIDKENLDKALYKAIKIIKSSDNNDIPNLLGDGIIDSLLKAIALPKADKDQSIYEYLLNNKHRLQILALIRMAIHRNYAIKGKAGETDVFVSPEYIQWYDDGVMFIQGKKQFEGIIGLYQNGRVKFGIATREIKGGESIGPDELEFVDVEEMNERTRQSSIPKSFDELDTALTELEELLLGRERDESKYQKYLINHPWIFGAEYKLIKSHKSFDDENVPDFTGLRVRDSTNDIIEIKSPFLSLFTQHNKFRAEFNAAWNQAERYLDFTRQEKDYLKRQKNLIFENPKCYLLVGYNLDKKQINEIRRKERMNPSITIYTYNDLLVMAKSTIDFVKNLKR